MICCFGGFLVFYVCCLVLLDGAIDGYEYTEDCIVVRPGKPEQTLGRDMRVLGQGYHSHW